MKINPISDPPWKQFSNGYVSDWCAFNSVQFSSAAAADADAAAAAAAGDKLDLL